MELTLPPDFKEFLRLLAAHEVEYLLIGGYAVGYYGYPRATQDMDVWIAVGPRNVGPTAGSPRQRAEADVARIIASFPPPPGAIRTGLIASLTVPGEGPAATPDIVTATQWWRAPGRPQAVLAWIRAHVPAGFTLGSYGSGSYDPSPSVALPSLGNAALPSIETVALPEAVSLAALPARLMSSSTQSTSMA